MEHPEREGSVMSTSKDLEDHSSPADATAPIDEQAEKALLRKLDRWIVPPVMLLYLLSFLDRVNIGNARLYGMEEDLGMTGNQFQIAVSVLFVTYILSETPSNLVIKYFTPSKYLAFLTVSWGVVATLTGIVQNYAGLLACRVILGALGTSSSVPFPPSELSEETSPPYWWLVLAALGSWVVRPTLVDSRNEPDGHLLTPWHHRRRPLPRAGDLPDHVLHQARVRPPNRLPLRLGRHRRIHGRSSCLLHRPDGRRGRSSWMALDHHHRGAAYDHPRNHYLVVAR
jgi:hypothetical protein